MAFNGDMTKVATNSTSGMSVVGSGTGFTSGVVSRIEAAAYKMMYDEGVLARLAKPIGQGQKGSAIVYPYWDPSNTIASNVAMAEGTDHTITTLLTNASVIIVASELGNGLMLSDLLREDGKVDIVAEASRQLGLAAAVALEKHCLGRLSGGTATTGTITGTNSTNGFTVAKYAAAKAKLDAAALTVPGRKWAVVPAYSWYYTAKGTFVSAYAPVSASYGYGPSVMGDFGNNVLSRYYVNTLFGDIDVFQHSLAYVSASSTAAGFVGVRDGLALWKPRDFRLEKERDASARGDELISSLRCGAKVLHTGYIQRLKMYAAAPS